MKKYTLIIFFIFSVTSFTAQVAINKDGSPPNPNSILHVKGSGGNHFFIHDITGNVGIGTLNPSERLHIVGNLKLGSLANGSGNDSLIVWSPVDSVLRIISPDRLNLNNVAFSTINNVTSNSPGDMANDDFVFGSDMLNHSGTYYNSRMLFDKSKGAFRVGNSYFDQWDDVNRGMYSAAMGYATIASGPYSFASGYYTTASGNASTAMGRNSTASGINATSLGSYSLAEGENSTSIGYYTRAIGENSIAIGNGAEANGYTSVALGYQSVANGDSSVVIGRNNTASGTSSFAVGYVNRAEGTASMAGGFDNTASGDYSIAAGRSNIASGTSSSVFGENNTADEPYAVAFGRNNNSTGDGAMVGGRENTASGNYSFVVGYRNTASGAFSFAAGEDNEAQGKSSFTMGSNLVAASPFETVFGQNNTLYTPQSTSSWNGQDRLFTIGNGTGSTRKDAMVVLKNGKVGINTSNPNSRLTIIGDENNGSIGALEIGNNGNSNRILLDGDEIDSNSPLFINSNSLSPVAIGTHDIASGYMVSVGGKMIAEEVRVQLKTAWPDYVFQEGYELPSLAEVEQYIKKEKHLPGIPSAEEVEKEGIHLGEMEVKLMEKIEELTLYFIELDQRIKKLESLKANER